MIGVYSLFLRVDSQKEIEIGKLGKIEFKPGVYVYIGSAGSGIHRLKRHINKHKMQQQSKNHWHIDYLLGESELVGYLFVEIKDNSLEERVAKNMASNFKYVNDFGSSDTHAPSHLFYSKSYDNIENCIIEEFANRGISNCYFGRII